MRCRCLTEGYNISELQNSAQLLIRKPSNGSTLTRSRDCALRYWSTRRTQFYESRTIEQGMGKEIYIGNKLSTSFLTPIQILFLRKITKEINFSMWQNVIILVCSYIGLRVQGDQTITQELDSKLVAALTVSWISNNSRSQAKAWWSWSHGCY